MKLNVNNLQILDYTTYARLVHELYHLHPSPTPSNFLTMSTGALGNPKYRKSLLVVKRFLGYVPYEDISLKYLPSIEAATNKYKRWRINRDCYYAEIEFLCKKMRNDDIVKFGGAKYKTHSDKDYSFYQSFFPEYKIMAQKRLSYFLRFEPQVEYSLYAETYLRPYVASDYFFPKMAFSYFDYRAASIYLFRELLLQEGREAAEEAQLYGRRDEPLNMRDYLSSKKMNPYKQPGSILLTSLKSTKMEINISLERPIIDLGNKDFFTVRDAVEGVQIFGGIGSGKTSGSGKLFALNYLTHHFGGLVLTAKPDEKEMWQEFCKQTGRLNDLIIIEPGNNQSFNFLEYEASKAPSKVSYTENIVQLLKTVIKASDETGAQSAGDDKFWENALDLLLYNVVDLVLLAKGSLDVKTMYDVVISAPKTDGPESNQTESVYKTIYNAAKQNTSNLISVWLDLRSPEAKKRLLSSKEDMEAAIKTALPEVRLMEVLYEFFENSYKKLSEKTRSIIEFSFTGLLFRLLREPIFSIFCSKPSTVTPDDCLKGSIILINLPVKVYNKIGRDVQIIVKYIWQRAMERRNIKENNRPVFLWADEAQNFLHEHDAVYQATARSSRIATVYITQNLPNYLASMGGNKSEHRVKGFLATLGTKIFHANADVADTNEYASKLIGEAYYEDKTQNRTVTGDFSMNVSSNYKLVRMVRPEMFVPLKTGGPKNNRLVAAYIHKQGNPFNSGWNHKEISFNQLHQSSNL